MDQETKVLLEWLQKNLTVLRSSGMNWQLVLNGTAGGDVRHEIKTTGEILAGRKHRQVIEERQRNG